MTDLPFTRDDTLLPGKVVRMEPLIRRVIAPNPGPYTHTGTCTYLIGGDNVAIIDPGPDDAGHLALLLAEAGSGRVSHIVVTHTHRDHTAGIDALRAATGATVVGCGPHVMARAPNAFERPDSAADLAYAPDRLLEDGESLHGDGWTLTAIATPGHTANHLAFALEETGALFSGDHVMGWSTTVVAPPDGSMSAYMAALEKLRARDDRIYFPGHGGPVEDPGRYVRGLISHRRQRETAILARIEAGDATIPAIVEKLYAGVDPRLWGGASMSVLAHIESLVEGGLVATDGPVHLGGRFARL